MRLHNIANCRFIGLNEGHWQVAPGEYPGMIPSLKGKVKKAKRHSFLVNPEDRERFLKNMKLA